MFVIDELVTNILAIFLEKKDDNCILMQVLSQNLEVNDDFMVQKYSAYYVSDSKSHANIRLGVEVIYHKDTKEIKLIKILESFGKTLYFDKDLKKILLDAKLFSKDNSKVIY